VAATTIAALAEFIGRSSCVESVDLSAFRRVVDYHPEDMTVTVETGMSWPELQASLGEHDQWLPIDPPLPDFWRVRDILDHAITGPRRCGYGLVRDWVLGLKVIMADGEVIHTGGKVVKNVAGYDLTKLFIGARGSLGVIVEATFKALPKPEAEKFAQVRLQKLEQVEDMLAGIAESNLTPTVLDVHNVPAAGETPGLWVVIGFAGAREDVEEQIAQAGVFGLSKPTDLGHEKRFWGDSPAGGVQTISILASKLTKKLGSLAPQFFVARAASGVIHYLGEPSEPEKYDGAFLDERVKKTYDPQNKFR
jgi:FAD/FMN-containing dehydrogenase